MDTTEDIEIAFSVTGGTRIGWMNATWPFAKLVVSPSLLSLSTIMGRYDFLSTQVVSFEQYGLIRMFASGIRIVHARPDYPNKIVFGALAAPKD